MRGVLHHIRLLNNQRIVYFRFHPLSTSPLIGKYSKKQDIEQDLLESIKERIEKNKKILRKHSSSHLKFRELKSSISNLQTSMAAVQKKQKMATEPSANSIVNIPSQASIEILGNGTGLLRACFVIRTPLKTYLFNCPENTCRFLWQLRIRSSSVMDVFITSGTWNNISGISSILLSKESNALATRLHGGMNIKHFLECIRPFQDSDYGNASFPSTVEERAYTMESYEDAGIRVKYIPLSPAISHEHGLNRKRTVSRSEIKRVSDIDIAYLVELKEAPRRIDPLKLMQMKIPKGPLIGKLKNGETVTLPDGRVVEPDQVFSSAAAVKEKPILLVVECSSEEHVKSLMDSESIQPFLNGEKKLDYCVHMSTNDVIKSPSYELLMQKLHNDSTEHILINDENPVIPAVESVYSHTRLLRKIAPSLFPPLHPLNWNKLVTQNDELQIIDGKFKRAAPLQRFWMRKGNVTNEEPIINDLRDDENELPEKAKQLVADFAKLESEIELNCEYPKITFLGTSSAVPSKYRNVTGYLIESTKNSAFLVDVGEGTYGQMRTALGDEECRRLLTNLHCVFITHAHQDHVNGLFTIITRRQDAFEKLGLEYKPLILVCNRNVLKPLKTFSICFENVEELISVVDISRHPLTPPPSPSEPAGKRPRLPSPHLPPARSLLEQMPAEFKREEWNVDEIKAVQVHHTRMANGYVLGIGGKRLVFSGDTKPCDLLCEEGKDADLLVHEATFEDGYERDALKKRHSTMGQAVNVAERMNAKNVVLTHFSARYPKVPVLPDYLDEKGIGVAMDMLRVRFDHLSLLPKLLPIYREVFVEELFELSIKKEQRALKEREAEERRQELINSK